MSMECYLAALSAGEAAQLQAEPAGVRRILDRLHRDEDDAWPRDPSTDGWPDSFAALDTIWTWVDWVLTGTNGMTHPSQDPLAFLSSGGEVIEGADVDFGARLVRPNRVQEIARLLSHVAEATIRARFDPAAMEAADLYPGAPIGEPDELASVLRLVEWIRTLFTSSARRGNAVLIVMV